MGVQVPLGHVLTYMLRDGIVGGRPATAVRTGSRARRIHAGGMAFLGAWRDSHGCAPDRGPRPFILFITINIVRLCTGVYRLLKTAKSTRSTRTPAAMNRM
jgi:hypothetical protein